jgi:hypothetical protein
MADVPLWDAINEYAVTCGGDTSNSTISPQRMDAVAKIERRLEELANEASGVCSFCGGTGVLGTTQDGKRQPCWNCHANRHCEDF